MQPGRRPTLTLSYIIPIWILEMVSNGSISLDLWIFGSLGIFYPFCLGSSEWFDIFGFLDLWNPFTRFVLESLESLESLAWFDPSYSSRCLASTLDQNLVNQHEHPRFQLLAYTRRGTRRSIGRHKVQRCTGWTRVVDAGRISRPAWVRRTKRHSL